MADVVPVITAMVSEIILTKLLRYPEPTQYNS